MDFIDINSTVHTYILLVGVSIVDETSQSIRQHLYRPLLMNRTTEPPRVAETYLDSSARFCFVFTIQRYRRSIWPSVDAMNCKKEVAEAAEVVKALKGS